MCAAPSFIICAIVRASLPASKKSCNPALAMSGKCNGRRNGMARVPRPLPLTHAGVSTESRPGAFSIRGAAAGGWLLLVFLVALQPVRADDDDDIAILIRNGAPDLAERLIERYQAAAGADPAAWARWEKQRIALAFARARWDQVLQRAAALPPAADPALRHWAGTRAAEAELALQRPAAARTRLAQLIWSKEPTLAASQLAEWRRLINETYLAERRFADDDRLAARVWLGEGRAEDAASLISDKTDADSQVWRLLADLRARRHSPETVLAQAEALANAAGTPMDAQRRLWAVAAEGAQLNGDAAARGTALERAVGGGPAVLVDGGRLHADPDTLWDAYLGYGMQLAQRAQLVADEYQPWVEIEQRLRDKKPLEARALMVVLAMHDPQQPLAATAHQRFAASLEESGRGAELEALYLHSTRFPKLDDVPAVVRYSLADVVLERGDLPTATRLIGDLPLPTAPGPVVTWQLARAQVLLAGGSVELGLSVLDTVMERVEDFDLAQRRAALRAVSAVQAQRRHQLALGLLQRIAAATPEMDLQRELQFWMGQSYEARGDYQRAALSYLRTAYLAGDEGARDSWGQRGRYQAAVALAQGGLAGDARRLYAGLVGVDSVPAQRAAALRALDQLGSLR